MSSFCSLNIQISYSQIDIATYVLSDFINLTQVHNFTEGAQDIFTFRRFRDLP